MMNKITEENVYLYAAKAYYKPNFATLEEFEEDYQRFKYVNRIISRYKTDDKINERLLLNHIIVICNSFGIKPSLEIFKVRLKSSNWDVLKPFLLYLGYIKIDDLTGISMDQNIVKILRKMGK